MPRPKLEEVQTDKSQPSTAVFVIGCGGTSEERYFSLLVGDNPNVSVRMLPPGKDHLSTPRQTVERVDDFWRNFELEEGDQVWIVLDVDDFFDAGNKIQTLDAIDDARQKKYQVVVSNPCLEIWFLMHTEEVITPWQRCDELVKHLRLKQGSYQKTRFDVEFYRPFTREALVRAKRNSDVTQMPPTNPGTQIYLLIEALDEVCGEDSLF